MLRRGSWCELGATMRWGGHAVKLDGVKCLLDDGSWLLFRKIRDRTGSAALRRTLGGAAPALMAAGREFILG